ncbi:MAG: AmmeMemoRadiSam system protein B, partial [candidate division WOR-3 bacterium]|nr:AmmeMemoRadiSam system protein B [candidate division WOR-3 bacterium]
MLREPVVAGQFYPDNKKILENELNELWANTPTQKIPGKILGIVVPHAGYPYSGPTAAYAYKAITNKDYQTVILIGPTHYVFFDGVAVYGKGSWQTPLGQVEVDEQLAQAIVNQNEHIKDSPQTHRQEHSLEVQIPFLQKSLTNFKIVPIMLCEPSYELCETLAKAIANTVKNKNVLLLASSDLYHGYSYAECKRTDSLTLSFLEKFDPKGLYQSLKQHKAQACGGDPIVVVMLASRFLGATHSKILYQTNPNDVMGERGGYCVGYG